MLSFISSNAAASIGVLLIGLTALWLISLKMRDASIIDIFWGMGFAFVGAVCLLKNGVGTPYPLMLAGLPIIWGLRLSLYLAKRNLGHGEDKRYIAMRKRSGLTEITWRKRAFFTIFLGQGLLIMLVSAPIWIGMGSYMAHGMPDIMGLPVSVLVYVGAAIWGIGFLFEAIGDAQLSKFMAKMKDYSGAYEDKPVLDTGLWRYTRHPNYFGNACMWWGTWLIACTVPWGWASIFGPIIMTVFLVRISGKDLLERSMKKRKPYQDYIARTSSFVPFPPR